MSAAQMELARLTALSIDDLLGSLTPGEEQELAELRARHPEFDSASLEHAIAALQLAVVPADRPLPELLHAQVAVEAADFFAQTPLPAHAERRIVDAVRSREASARRTARRRRVAAWGGIAAAVIAGLALYGSRTPIRPPMPTVTASVDPRTQSPRAPAPSPSAAPVPATDGASTASGAARVAANAEAVAARAAPSGADPAAQRKAFLATHRWYIQRSWEAGSDPTGLLVRGDVVWDPQSQTGFLRFVGLQRNNPMVEQYQLWIFDGRRDQRYPVDGGVFDANPAADGEVVIPIRSKLRVDVALMFAVTVEHRGGVVVSDRSRLAAIAHVS